jgi:prevent-host-death family protein
LTNEATYRYNVATLFKALRVKVMETIGIRKLKENLSRYMKLVKSGEKIVVTDRKKEIAVIIPFEKATKEEEIFKLIQRGMAFWSGGKPLGMTPRIASRGKSVSGAVVEDRR